MTDEAIIAAFHCMWDAYPTRARLIAQDRTVIAVNRAGEEQGMRAGVKCVCEGEPGSHAGCLANEALRERCAKCAPSVKGDKMRFWIPVVGRDGWYVHFSVVREAGMTP